MTQIPNKYRKNGYDYTLLIREDNVAIYAQAKGGREFGFEVVKIRVRPAHQFKDKDYPESEKLPSDEEWGAYGKTFGTYGTSQACHVAAIKAAKAQMGIWVAEAEQNALK